MHILEFIRRECLVILLFFLEKIDFIDILCIMPRVQISII